MPLLDWSGRVSTPEKSPGAGLFDAPAEWVIAQGRLFLCALSLLAIYLVPPEPAHFASAIYLMLISYFVYAVGLVLATNWRLPDPSSQRGIHAGDVIATSLLLLLTESPTSQFFAFFTFILLAATLRWNWRGVLATLAVLVVALLASSFGQGGRPPAPQLASDEFSRVIIRIAYLAVIGGMLAYVSAYRERSRERLAKLAEWPAYAIAEQETPAFASTLAHAANALGAPRVLTIWEEADEPFVKIASWKQGSYQQIIDPPDTFADLVSSTLTKAAFATDNAASDLALLRTGHTRVRAPLVDPDLLRRFKIVGMASAPFAGAICRGRVFILDRTVWSDDQLLLTEIIASRMGIELDRQVLHFQAEDAAAMRERINLARDLHDGILQSLTAAGLQLKLLSDQLDEETRCRLDVVKRLLANEQRRIREFVQAMRPNIALSGEVVLSQNLRHTLMEVARNWNCALSFTVEPDNATVSKNLAAELSFMLSEAIANAVRHGEASKLDIAVHRADDSLAIGVHDNGRGFGSAATDHTRSARGASHTGPASLRERVGELGGSLEVLSSSTGAELQIRLPMS